MIRRLSTLALAACLVAAAGAVRALEPADPTQAIESATTPADHEALAAYYEGEAKQARAKADEHRRMAAAYRSFRVPAGTKGNRSGLQRTMPGHCDRVVASYTAAADEYEAMAAAHREAAKEAQ
jgi:hypothetical protein